MENAGPLMTPEEAVRRTLARLAEKHVVVPELIYNGTPCQVWVGYIERQGYGIVTDSRSKESRVAHRVRWEIEVGPVPKGMEVDHLCRNRACINLAHLEAVPHRVNVARGLSGSHQAKRTECPKGHPYDAENTRWLPDGSRECKECKRIAKRKLREGGPGRNSRYLNRDHCSQGHVYDEASTQIYVNPKTGSRTRRCKPCMSIWAAKRYAQRKDVA
jgi:hypothetical protein